MTGSSFLRVAACLCFILALIGIAIPVALIPLGLLLWCLSTLVP